MKELIALLLLLSLVSCKEEEKERPEPDPGLVYFQVAEMEEVHGDSYILALEEESAIEEARSIISGATGSKIVLASITKDEEVNDYPNIDLKTGVEWSWHVANFEGFTDFTIEIYDGWPTYVEENYTEWVENTKNENGRGVIGFWSYTVVREVSPEELR